MRNVLIFSSCLFLFACSSNSTGSVVNPNTPDMQSTLPGSQELQPTLSSPSNKIDNPYSPKADDSNLKASKAFIDTTEIFIMESFPIQIGFSLSGNLPSPCHQLRIIIESPDKNKEIHINVYSVVQKDQICAQVLEPFQVRLNLGSFPTGHYSIFINQEKINEFDS